MNTKPLKLQNLAKKHKPNTHWSQEAKVAAVTQYLVLGNMALVATLTGIPHVKLRQWKMEPWWAETEAAVRATENIQMDSKLTKIVDRSLDAVLDRVENGEFIYDQKTGEIKRRPVSFKDAAKVSVDLITKRELLRGNATERTAVDQIPIADQLKALALEFAKWAPNAQKKQETIDVSSIVIEEDVSSDDDAFHHMEMKHNAFYEEREEGLQEGTQLGENNSPGESETTSGEGRSPSSDGEEGFSPQGRW